MSFAQALVALIKSIFKFNGPAQSPETLYATVKTIRLRKFTFFAWWTLTKATVFESTTGLTFLR